MTNPIYLRTAYHAGRHAALAGHALVTCPYEGGAMRNAWECGHLDVQHGKAQHAENCAGAREDRCTCGLYFHE